MRSAVDNLGPWQWVARRTDTRASTSLSAVTYVEARARAVTMLSPGATLENTEVRAVFEYEIEAMRARAAEKGRAA